MHFLKHYNQIKTFLLLNESISRFVIGAEGNSSVKTPSGFYIKASGASCKNMKKTDMVYCGWDGQQLSNFNKKPSMETDFHRWLLSFEDVNYVAHTHPINTLKILCTDYIFEFAEKRLFPDQVVYNGTTSCIVPYETPGEELAAAIKKNVSIYLENSKKLPKLILLKNHGIICLGSSYQQCIVATEICEKAAEIYLGIKQLGKEHFLSDSEILLLEHNKNEQYRKSIINESNIR